MKTVQVTDRDQQQFIIEQGAIEVRPIPQSKLQGLRYFLGLFAGEHVAGTEFVIGATFVMWGVNTTDILLGLLFGNLLAVLTWAFICAPIATDTRLTLYTYLGKIAGPYMQQIYNAVNGILFCVLGGAMISVSASAVRVLFNIPVQTHWYPTSISFILLVILIGAVVTIISALGFKSVSQFSVVCSPWLIFVFISGGFIALPEIMKLTGSVSQLHSLSDFFRLANESIWTGKSLMPGQELGMVHVIAFAWIANLAMHGGLSDMALFRYAKSYKYGFASAAGMFFGHYIAWITAGMMGAAAALLLNTTITKLDAGEVAFQVLGSVGLLGVIIAGWTTSNPTLYRAGLAFQTIFKRHSINKVTIVTGVITTLVACFPFVFTNLLELVGLMGLLVLPVGTIVFTEHWIFPKIRYTRYWAQYKKVKLNIPALTSWILACIFVLSMSGFGIIHLFFLVIPTWFVTMVLYIVLAGLAGAKNRYPYEEKLDQLLTKQLKNARFDDDLLIKPKNKQNKNKSNLYLGAVAALSLLASFLWSIGIFTGDFESVPFKKYAIYLSIVYFIFATLYIRKKEESM